jgi:hypothetical protein
MADQGATTALEPKRAPAEYRQSLVAAEQKCQDDFDKTVLSLSGGALGVSFVFVKDIVGTASIAHPSWLLAAWLTWALSSLAVLTSFFMSHLALRKSINQCDDGSIYTQKPGGRYSDCIRILNPAGALLFVIGVCFMAAFAYTNLITRGTKNVGQEATQPATTSAASASAAAVPHQR